MSIHVCGCSPCKLLLTTALQTSVDSVVLSHVFDTMFISKSLCIGLNKDVHFLTMKSEKLFQGEGY